MRHYVSIIHLPVIFSRGGEGRGGQDTKKPSLRFICKSYSQLLKSRGGRMEWELETGRNKLKEMSQLASLHMNT